MKQKLLKSLLLAATLLVGGANYAWADDYSSVYTRATVGSWVDGDKTDWSASGAVEVNATYGLGANANTTATYVNKTFSISENSKIKYEVSWTFATATGRDVNWNWIQFGDFLRIGVNSSYNVKVSTNAGSTWNETSLGYYYNTTKTASITLIFNTANKTVESFEFEGTDRTALVSGTFTGKNFNAVSTGFTRGGSVGWGLNNYLTTITVSEAEQAIATADYTINYKDGGDIVKTTAGNVAVGTVIPVESTFWVSTTKYIKDGGEPSSLAVAAGGSTLNISVSEAPTYSYTANGKVGGAVQKVLASGSVYAGEAAPAFFYPQYLKVGSILYGTPRQQGGTGYYKYTTYVPTSDDDILDIIYTASMNGVVFFSEGEDIEGASSSSGSNADIRCSMGAGGHYEAETNIVELPAGRYHIYTQVWGGTGTDFVFMAGEETIHTASTTGSLSASDASFTLDATTTITLPAVGSGSKVLDWIYIIDETAKEIADAIADCKQYEASDAFATDVAGESFASAAEVYEFHTAWQIAQADAASSNDITKVIRNAAVANGTDWNSGRTNSGQQYTDAPDNTYFDAWDKDVSNASQTIYGLPAGTYTLKVATRASETLTDIDKYNIWVNDGTADEKVLGHHEGNDGNFLGNGWNWTFIPFTLSAKANVSIGFYSLPGNGSKLWAGCDDWHLYKGTLTHPVSISELGWATLYTPYALNFAGTGLTAYTASLSEGIVTLTPVTDVPANTGVVLNGAAGSYNIPTTASSETPKGALTGNATEATAIEGGHTYYVLAKAEDYPIHKVQFRPVTDGPIAAGKAFLDIASGGSSVKAFDIDIAGVDAIDDVRSKMEEGRSEIFNLAGQRMNRLQKGVNIVNGKKVMVK